MSTNWRTPATARTHSWNRCPWQNTRSSRSPGVWSAATGGTSVRCKPKAKRLSWRTSLERHLTQAVAVAVGEAQPLARPLAQPLAQRLPQAVGGGEAQHLAQRLSKAVGEGEARPVGGGEAPNS